MLGKVMGDSTENAMIVACSVGIGLGVTVVPEIFAVVPKSFQILTSNGIVAGSITAIVLNILFNMIPARRKSKVAARNTKPATASEKLLSQN